MAPTDHVDWRCRSDLDAAIGEILVAVIHCFELAAIRSQRSLSKATHRPAELDEPGTKLLDGRAVVLTQVRNGLTDRAATSPRRCAQLRVPAGYHCSLAPQIRSCW